MPDVRLIDANALMKNIGKIPRLRGITYGRMKKAVEETPTIDTVPVVHGRWNPSPYTKRRAKCSNCEVSRDIYTQIAWNYCPNCGAKMDGGAQE